MSSGSLPTRVADRFATILRPIIITWRWGSYPLLRLWRLAGLRSQTEGNIPVSTQFDGPVHSTGHVTLNMGQHCRLGRGVFFETPGGRITLGSHVRINTGCILVSYSSISIGSDCLIGEFVSIRDADHGIAPEAPMRTQPHVSAPIVIGDNVWIARGVVILKGVTIGSGAIVAANSVVNRDVPPDTVMGGVPATPLKKRSTQPT